MKVKDFFSDSDKQRIVDSIKSAEKNTSGEIRVHIESKCNGDPYMKAAYVFEKLGMFNTSARNAVLIYLAVNSRKFAIIGDSGINEKVGPDFWNSIKEDLSSDFSSGDFTGGISKAIVRIGDSLKVYFPYTADDINEQSDEISFGE